MRLLLLLLAIKLAAGQLGLSNDVELVPAMPNMPQITGLDVQCEKSGMTVNVEFSLPFDGVIFSKGHFSNPACRYVRANSGRTSYTFVIPMTGCGTRTFDNSDDGSTGFENMIMIQNEEFVQEVWDTARKITCDWTTRMEKLITFRPFAVDMLEAKEVRYSGDDIMCWMDIQLGKGPFASSLDGIVKIGEELAVVIHSKDGGGEFDMLVKNCFAYDSEDLDDERTTRLQLSDERGCLLKPKLMSYFTRTYDTGTTGADIIAYASLYAFKFPDKMDVYLSCEVELCKGGCTNMCEDPGFPSNIISRLASTTTTTSRPPPINPCLTRPGSPQCCGRIPNHLSCTTTTTRRPSTTTRPDPCITNPGSFQCCARNPSHPRCTTTTTRRPSTTTRPHPCVTSPGSFQCCARNPSHPRCTTTTTRRPSTTTRPDPCVTNPGSFQCCARNPSHPRCTTTTTRRPSTTTRPDPCVRNPGSPQCCAKDPSHPRCVTEAPCSGPRDPRPQCQPSTTPPSTTPNLENHAFHAWQNRPSGTRRRRPPYGTRLSPEVLAELKNLPRRRRDVALPPPPPPPPRNTISMVRGFRVVGANDLTFPTAPLSRQAAVQVDSVCVPTATFTIGLLLLSLLLIAAVLVATFTCLRLRAVAPCKSVEAKNPYYKQ